MTILLAPVSYTHLDVYKRQGELDDVRYFDHPDRFNADIMWFTEGYVEYVIPNLTPRNQKITQLSLSAEISSEAPGKMCIRDSF